MNTKILSIFAIFTLILVIPTANAQLTIGSEAKQELIEVKINDKGEINVKHIVRASTCQVLYIYLIGTISNLVVTNEIGEEKQLGIINDGLGNKSVFIFHQNKIQL